ncbi:hypothetical protein ACGFX4_40975 [Kitasatospora sp. NPDC048365]|uniref:hypothetical protein n=1 Tax=Kitasatospora sp. NPDC048365 TaxID=3364050 RepID=UPI0037233714
MIEIRVICETGEVPHVVADLCRLWSVQDVKEYPAHEPNRLRLYIRAERRPAPAK